MGKRRAKYEKSYEVLEKDLCFYYAPRARNKSNDIISKSGIN
jgi:hypothetical protein